MKRKPKKCVYAGSFDPLTNGHMWMIREGSRLFDDLIVAAAVNPDKKYTFTLEDRLYLLEECTKDLENVTVGSIKNQFLINYARSVGADFILRGIRSFRDYEIEKGMRNINADIDPNITTCYLMQPIELTDISSSMVKGLIGPEGWEELIKQYVPEPVFQFLLKKYKK